MCLYLYLYLYLMMTKKQRIRDAKADGCLAGVWESVAGWQVVSPVSYRAPPQKQPENLKHMRDNLKESQNKIRKKTR